MHTFLIMAGFSIAILTIALAGMGIRILLVKNGHFPKTSVGANPEMKKMGLTCAKCDELKHCGKAGQPCA